ncbi:hypothetical protein [Natrinema altunense]|uniref:hypothetical protein n=1 Tax=Natrinema altunense TaxID=222984 RepID=UPI0012696008|nr:hypothetical protein [Natrinema altunense]
MGVVVCHWWIVSGRSVSSGSPGRPAAEDATEPTPVESAGCLRRVDGVATFVFALEVAALPEVRRVAVLLVLVAMVDVDAIGDIERTTAAGTASTAAVVVNAFTMSVP